MSIVTTSPAVIREGRIIARRERIAAAIAADTIADPITPEELRLVGAADLTGEFVPSYVEGEFDDMHHLREAAGIAWDAA